MILNARTDELMAHEYTSKLVEQLMYEVAVGAKSYGRIISDRFIQTMLDYTVKMTPYRHSMKIDYDESSLGGRSNFWQPITESPSSRCGFSAD